MWISAKGEYALRAVLHLASNYGQGFVRIQDISREQRIPIKFLEQILLILKNAGYLESKRGSGGGYFLTRRPGEIHLAEIIRTMEVSLAPVDCISEKTCSPCDQESSCDFQWLWRDIKAKTVSILEKTTFQDVCDKRKRKITNHFGENPLQGESQCGKE